MYRTRVFRALVVLMLAISCVSVVLAQGGSIGVGGTITDSSFGVTEYQLYLESGQSVIIDLMSDDFDTYLEVFDASGQLVAGDDDSGDGLNSRIAFSAEVTGAYTIRVRSFSVETANGTFTLGVQAASTTGGGTISIGDSITTYSFGVTEYQLYLETGQSVRIDLSSGEFDTYLEIYDANGQIVASDDDGGDGQDSRLSLTAGYTGVYRIRVRSFSSDNANGEFTLAVLASNVIRQLAGGQLNYGDVINVIPNGAITISFSFIGNAGDVVDISAVSQGSEDSRLILRGPGGVELAEDDDSGANANPVITRFELPGSSTYTVDLQGYGEVSLYEPLTVSLQLTELLILNAGPQTVTLGSSHATDGMVLNTEASGRYLVTVTVDQDTASTLNLGISEAGEYSAGTRLSILGTQEVTFVFESETSGRASFALEYYDFDGSTVQVTIKVERIKGLC